MLRILVICGLLAIIGVLVAVLVLTSSAISSADDRNREMTANESFFVENDNITALEILRPETYGTRSFDASEPESNPEAALVAFTMLAIGDWGSTTDKPGSCCNRHRRGFKPTDVGYKQDYHAQVNVATLLGQSAAQLKPVAILGHGDNVYWNGVGPKDAANRMAMTFDGVYTAPSLQSVPWWNVAGNHDIGGAMYICGAQDYQFRPCASAAELVSALEAKFDLQRDYVSPNNNRWIMKDHYYKQRHVEKGVSVDVFNVDTNYADSHAAQQVCCQCYGYSQGSALVRCNDISRGNRYCAGGDTGMFDACMARIKAWWTDSLVQIERDLKASDATFKVINTHYSPHFHMGVPKMKTWYRICSQYGVHLWLNGHTHSFSHQVSSWGTHFIENGGGGGIQTETSTVPAPGVRKYVRSKWVASRPHYGYFELSFSKDWLKAQFVTFDDTWKYSLDRDAVQVGGLARGHCWQIGRTGKKGKAC